MKERQKRPKYTKEFKQDDVRPVTEQGCSGPEVAGRPGIPGSNVTRRVSEYRQDQLDFNDNGITRKELEAENRIETGKQAA